MTPAASRPAQADVDASPPAGSKFAPAWLWTALLAGELLAASVIIDADQLASGLGLPALRGVGTALMLGLGAATVWFALSPPARRERPVETRLLGAAIPAHILAYVALLAMTALLANGARATSVRGAWWGALSVWGASLVVGSGSLRLTLRDTPRALGALAIGAAALLTGRLTADVWGAAGGVTLDAAALLLRAAGESVTSDASTRMLAVGDFWVHVAPECAGYEGVGLMLVVLTAYLVGARDRLVMRRAFWALPVGVALIALLNIVRIAALMWLGANVSGVLALSGFHSKAGWALFCVTSLGVVAVTERFAGGGEPEQVADTSPLPGDAGLLIPEMAWVGALLATGLFATGLDRLYGLRVITAAGCLWWLRSRWNLGEVLSVRRSSAAVALGVAVGVVYVWMVTPDASAASATHDALAALPAFGRAAWWVPRVIGALLVAPLCEELAFRVFLFERLEAVIPHGRGRVALVVLASAALFGIMHQAVAAGAVAGVALAAYYARGRSLRGVVMVHAVANVVVLGWAVLGDRLDLL